MMSSVTDRPYSGKSIYRRRCVFLSRSPRVVVKFPDPQHKTLFVELFTTSARRQCVNVLLMCFCCFLRTVSNTVIHFEARLAAGISFCAAVRGGTKGWRGELHVSVDTMKWLIDYTGAGLIKIHRGGAETHNGRRGNKLLTRTFKTLHKLYISINWRPALLIHQLQTQRSVWQRWTLRVVYLWICVLYIHGCVYERTGGCTLREPCYAEIRAPPRLWWCPADIYLHSLSSITCFRWITVSDHADLNNGCSRVGTKRDTVRSWWSLSSVCPTNNISAFAAKSSQLNFCSSDCSADQLW